MRSIPVISSFCSLLVLIAGCGSPSPMPDAATRPDSAMADASRDDAGPLPDAGIDAASPDAAAQADANVDGGDPCDACSGTTACLRGVCVETCGGDLALLDGSLAAGLVPVANYCRTPSAFAFAGGRVYEVSASTAALVTTFTLSRWTPVSSGAPTVEVVGTATYTAAAGDSVFTGGSIAVSQSESQVVFGFTTSPSFVGGIFDLDTGTGLAVQTDAPGNFGAAFLDETYYLINGLGLGTASGGQGLYRGVGGAMGGVQVVQNLGEYSGSVALWSDEDLVLAGGASFGTAWADGETGNRVLVLGASALIAATAPIDGATVQQIDAPSAFELIAGPRLASVRWGASIEAIEARSISTDAAGDVVLAAPEDLTSGATFTGVGPAGDAIILAHGDGLLFVR